MIDDDQPLTCASVGPDGWPQLASLRYVLRGGRMWAWTDASSPLVRNVELDPRVGVQVGDETARMTVTVHRDPHTVADLGMDLYERRHGLVTAEVATMVRRQAARKVGLEFVPVEGGS